MNTMSSQSLRQRSGSTAPVAAHKTSSLQFVVSSSGRGSAASTSGRGQFTLAPVRAVRLLHRSVLNEAAALEQGAPGLSDLLDKDLAEPVLTPRRIMNRRIKSCQSLASLSDLILDEVSNFDQQNVSHALSRLAKMGRTRGDILPHHFQPQQPSRASGSPAARQQQLMELKPAVEHLTRRMHQLIRSYDSWDLTLSLWAYGQLGYHDEAALRALCEAALAVTPLFKPADCATAVVAFAYLDYLHSELMRRIVSVMLDSLYEFQPGEVTQVLWGFAKLGCHPGTTVLHEVVATVHGRLRRYATKDLNLALWSLVRLGYKPGVRFLYDAETTLLQRLPHMAPADLSLSVWTFAHLRYKAVRLLDEVPAAVGPQLRNFSNGELCSLASGFATAHHYHRVLLDEVAGVMLSRIETLAHQEVCVVLWTYGTFRHRPTQADFSKQMAATLYSRMPYFSPQGLAMIVKALAQLQWRSEPLMVALMAAAETKLNGFKPLELSQLLWGLSALQCTDLGIYYAVVRRCIAILKDPRHPHYRTMMHHRVVNSVIASCQQLGYVPWTLIDFAESKGIRVKEPGILSSRDEDDEGIMMALLQQPTAEEDAEEEDAAVSHAASAANLAWQEADEAAPGAAEEEEEGDDVMASDLAVNGGRGRRHSASESLLLLQQQQQDSKQDPQPLQQEQEESVQGRQGRRRHAAAAVVVERPTPIDQRAPLRVGVPPNQRPGPGHQSHHRHGEHHPHGRSRNNYDDRDHRNGHSHRHEQHADEYPDEGEDEVVVEPEPEAVKVLVPTPRVLRRPVAGDPAAHSPPSPDDPNMQQQQRRGRARQQPFASPMEAAAVVAPVPVPLSPPPAALPLQQQQPRQTLQQRGGGGGGASSNGNGNGNGLPVALER